MSPDLDAEVQSADNGEDVNEVKPDDAENPTPKAAAGAAGKKKKTKWSKVDTAEAYTAWLEANPPKDKGKGGRGKGKEGKGGHHADGDGGQRGNNKGKGGGGYGGNDQGRQRFEDDSGGKPHNNIDGSMNCGSMGNSPEGENQPFGGKNQGKGKRHGGKGRDGKGGKGMGGQNSPTGKGGGKCKGGNRSGKGGQQGDLMLQLDGNGEPHPMGGSPMTAGCTGGSAEGGVADSFQRGCGGGGGHNRLAGPPQRQMGSGSPKGGAPPQGLPTFNQFGMMPGACSPQFGGQNLQVLGQMQQGLMYAMPYYVVPSPHTPLGGNGPCFPGPGCGSPTGAPHGNAPGTPGPQGAPATPPAGCIGTVAPGSPMGAGASMPTAGMAPIAPEQRQHVVSQVQQQMEYYFGQENLSKDFWLRKKMDDEGWLPVSLIASFRRMESMTQDITMVQEAIEVSPKLELDQQGIKVRLMDSWNQWVITPGSKAQEILQD